MYKEDNRQIRMGRKLADFLREYRKYPFCILTQMDTVEGPKEQDKCLLTLNITNTHFMLVKVLEKQNKECVAKAFRELWNELGPELYKQLFRFLLTDRGTELCDPESIEIGPATGECIAHMYFCDSCASYQKGAIEENHALVRYIIPKRFGFEDLSQVSADLMMSHINSYHRKSLQGTPYELTEALLGSEFLEKTRVRPIPSDSVTVSPKLLR